MTSAEIKTDLIVAVKNAGSLDEAALSILSQYLNNFETQVRIEETRSIIELVKNGQS